MFQHVLLIEVFEENPDSHRYVVGNKRSILIDFSENFGYSSWYLHQNLISGCLLKLHCNVKSETKSMNIATLLHWMVYFALWLVFYFLMIFYIDHLKNIGSLSYATLSNINIFYKNIFVNISTIVIRKLCKDWEALKLTVAIAIFPKF